MSGICVFLSLVTSDKMSIIVSLCRTAPPPAPLPRKFLPPACAFIPVAMHPPPAPEFTVDIEVSFENASFLEPIRAYLNSLRFPVQGNDTDPATRILNIEVTTGE